MTDRVRKKLAWIGILICCIMIPILLCGCKSQTGELAEAVSEESEMIPPESEGLQAESQESLQDSSEEEPNNVPLESDKLSAEKNNEKSEQSKEEYFDESYVDAHDLGEEEDDLSKYRTEENNGTTSGQSSGNTDSDQTAGGEENAGQDTASNAGDEYLVDYYQNENGGKYSDGSRKTQDKYQTDPIPEGQPNPVEPEDVTVNTEEVLTCVLFVECGTIFDNWDDLTKGKENLVPSDGVIYDSGSVVFYEGESVYDVLLREMQNNRIHMDSTFTPAYNSAYVKGINNLYEFDCGRWSGWMYCVNGWYPNYGASRYMVKQGDVIEWHYTCDLGRDLGTDVSQW